jgi:outer membrane protein assembly factor BamB
MKRYQSYNQLIKLAVAFAFLCCIQYSHAQWPQWRGPDRDAVSSETRLLKEWPLYGPKLLWSTDKVGDGFSSTAIQDQVAYTLGKQDSLEIITAIDLNGKILWQNIVGNASRDSQWPQSRSTPTIYQNKVYVITVCGDVACFEAKTGNLVWKIHAFDKFESKGHILTNNGGISESPLVVDNKLIITPCGNITTVVALDPQTGETIWKSESIKDTTMFSSPVLIQTSNTKGIFTTTRNYDLIVDCNSGKIIWKDKHITGIIPQVINNQIYFTGEYNQNGRLCAWNNQLNKLSTIWTDTIAAYSIGGAVFFKDKIIVSGAQKGLFCIDLKTGKTLSINTEMRIATLIMANGMIYSYEQNGRVGLVKLNDDNSIELVNSFKIKLGQGPFLSHLSIANGVLFVRHGKFLLAYDIRQSI